MLSKKHLTTRWAPAFVASTGLLSLVLLPLSVLAVLLHVIALAATTRMDAQARRWVLPLLVITGLCSVGAMARFVLSDALAGIVEARGRDSSARAVSILREILFAEDAMRRYGFIDPDGDGVGSAGRLGELSGVHGARGGKPLSTPPLAPRLAPGISTRSGPALEQGGYYFVVCVPGPAGSWATDPSDPVDEEAAERRFVAYAWPSASGAPHSTAFFMDEHERILESDNRLGSELRLVGPSASPECEDAQSHPELWRPWRGKKPRTTLPGGAPRL
jgi:hypothetical protein